MRFSLFIALRYLKSQRGNRFFSRIGTLSVIGIAIGVAAMIVVLSVINGFEKELRGRFLAANAHVMAFHYPAGLERPELWMRQIERDFPQDVKAVAPFIHSETMVRKDGLMHNILVRGIHPLLREKAQSSAGFIRPGTALNELQARLDNDMTSGEPPIILGAGLLSILNGKVGETVELVDPQAKDNSMKKFRVVGVYDSGLKHYDNKLGFLSLNDAQAFFGIGKRVTGIEIGLFRPEDSKNIAVQMSEKYTITIKEWQSFNKSLFEAMEMERAVIGLIVALVAFVASFNILTTLFISVTQKQRDISVLKAIGASHRLVMKIFLMQGALIGFAGSVIGMALALLLCFLLSRYQFIDLPDLYLLARLPMTYNPAVYAIVALSGIAICVIAGFYPARVASRVVVTEGLRK